MMANTSQTECIVCPFSAEELRENLSDDELMRKLRTMDRAVRCATAAKVDRRSFNRFAVALSGNFFLKHRNRNVQLLVASIILELFRLEPRVPRLEDVDPFAFTTEQVDETVVCGVDSPFVDARQLEKLLTFLTWQLQVLESPDSMFYRRGLQLIERSTVINPFKYCAALKDPESVACCLLQRVFAVVRCSGESAQKVTELSVTAISSLAAEMSIVPVKLLSLLLPKLVSNDQSSKWEVKFVKFLLVRCSETLAPHVDTLVRSLLKGDRLSDPECLSSQERHGTEIMRKLSENVYELLTSLCSLAPGLVGSSLGSVAVRLKFAGASERHKLIETVALMFSNVGCSLLIGSQHQLWAAFVTCADDPDVTVRQICIRAFNNVVDKSLELVDCSDFTDCLLRRTRDVDPAVRRDAVNVVVTMTLNRQTTDKSDGRLLDSIKERTRDVKFSVRDVALRGLSRVFSARCRKNENVFWIADLLLHAFCSEQLDDRIVIEEVFVRDIVPFQLDCVERMQRLRQLYNNADTLSIRCVNELFLMRRMLCGLLRPSLLLLRRAADGDISSRNVSGTVLMVSRDGTELADTGEKVSEETAAHKLRQLSYYVRSVGVRNGEVSPALRSLLGKCDTDPVLHDALLTLTRPGCTVQDARRCLKIALAKLQKCATASSLVGRLAPLLVDKVSIREILATICSHNSTSSSDIQLVVMLSRANAECFYTDEILEILTDVLQSSQGTELVDCVLCVLTNIGNSSTERLQNVSSQQSQRLLTLLQRQIVSDGESVKTLKRSVVCLAACFTPVAVDTVFTQLIKSSLAHLRLGSRRLVRLLVAIGNMAEKCPAAVTGDKEILQKLESFFTADIFNDFNDDDRLPGQATNAKLQGLKMLTRCAMGISGCFSADEIVEFPKRLIGFLHSVVLKVERLVPDLVSAADAGRLRLQAACCVLKMARVPAYVDLMGYREFEALVPLMMDDTVSIRKAFVNKLHRGLISLRIPLRYASLLCLAGSWYRLDGDNAEVTENHLGVGGVRRLLAANVQKRRQILETRGATYSATVVLSLLPEYILAYSISLLANFVRSPDDIEELLVAKQCLSLLIEVLTEKYSFSASFYCRMFDVIRMSRDAIHPASLSASLKLYTVCELARLLVLGVRAPKSCTVSYYPSHIILPTQLFTDYQSHRKIRSIVLPDELLQHSTKKSGRKRSRSGRLVDSTVSTTNVENVSPESRSGVRKSASLLGKLQPAVLDFDELENENILINNTTPGSSDIGKRHRNKSAAETFHVGLHEHSGSTTRSSFRPRLDRAARSLDFSDKEMTEDLSVSGPKSGKMATKKMGEMVVDVNGGNVTDEIGDRNGKKSRKPTSAAAAAAAAESEKIVGKVQRTYRDVLEPDQDTEIKWKNGQKRDLEVLESEMSAGDAVVPLANAGERWKMGKRRSELDRTDVDYTPNATSLVPVAHTQPENDIVCSPDDRDGFIPHGYNGGNAMDQVEEESEDSGEEFGMVSGGLMSSTEDLSKHRRADSDAPCMDLVMNRDSKDSSDPRYRDVLTGRRQSSERKESPSTSKTDAKKANRCVTPTTATSTPRRPSNRQMTTTITEKTPQNRLAATFDTGTILSGTTGSARSVKFNFGTSPFSDNFDIMSLASSCGFLDLLSTPAITSNDCLFLPVVKSHSSPHGNGVAFVAMPTRRRRIVPMATTVLNDVNLRDTRPAVVESTDRELDCDQVENSDAGFPGCPIPDHNSEDRQMASVKKLSRTELRQQDQKLKEPEDSTAVERTAGKTRKQQLYGSRLVAVKSMRADHGECKTGEMVNGKPSRKRLCRKSCQIPVTTRGQTAGGKFRDSESYLSTEMDTTLESQSMRTTKGKGGNESGPDMEMVDIHLSVRTKLPDAGGGKSKEPQLVDRGRRVALAEQSCKPPSRGMKAGLKRLGVKESNEIQLQSGKSDILDSNDVVMATKDSSMLTAHVVPDINIDDGNSHNLLSSDYNNNSHRGSPTVSGKPLSTPAAPVSRSVVDMSVSEDLTSAEARQQTEMGKVRCSRVPSRSSVASGVASVSSNSLFETSTEKRKRCNGFTVQNSIEHLYAPDRGIPMEVSAMDQDVDVTTTTVQEYHSSLNYAAQTNKTHPGNNRSMDHDVENRSRCSVAIGAISITSSSSYLETGAGPTPSQLITSGQSSTRKADLIPEKFEESVIRESDTQLHREDNPSCSQPLSQPVDSSLESAVDRSARETIFPATTQLDVDLVGSMPTDSSANGKNEKLESRVKSSFATWTDVCGISEGNLSASESPASDTLPYTSMDRKQMEMGGRWKSNVEPPPTSTIVAETETERPKNGKSSVAIPSNCLGSAPLTAARAPDSNRFYGNRLPLHGHKGLPMDSERCRQQSSVSLPMSSGAQQRHSTNSEVETSGNETKTARPKGGDLQLELSASAQRASIETISTQTSQSVQGKSSEPDIRLFIGSGGDFPRAVPGFPESQNCVPGNSQLDQVGQSEHPSSQTGRVKASSAIPCIFSTGSFRESPAVIRQPRENPTIMSVPGNDTLTRPNEKRPSVRQQKSSFVTDVNHNRVFAGNESESCIDSSSREPNGNYVSCSRDFRSSAQLDADHFASQSLSQTLRGKASEPVTFISAVNPVHATTENPSISSDYPAVTGFAEDIHQGPELPPQSGYSIGSHTSPTFPDSGEASDDSGLAVVCSQDSVQSTGGKGWKSSVAIHYADL